MKILNNVMIFSLLLMSSVASSQGLGPVPFPPPFIGGGLTGPWRLIGGAEGACTVLLEQDSFGTHLGMKGMCFGASSTGMLVRETRTDYRGQVREVQHGCEAVYWATYRILSDGHIDIIVEGSDGACGVPFNISIVNSFERVRL